MAPAAPGAGREYSAECAGIFANMSKLVGWACVIAFVIWSLVAVQWMDKGCDAVEAYAAVFEYGVPEGLEFLPACNS